MKSTVEPLEGNKVKLSIEVDEAEFERAIDAAFKRIAQEVRLPGFRPGKAPRKLLEARLGKNVGREEALRVALPDYYSQAVRENAVDVIAAPEIDLTSGSESGPVQFDAVVQIRPEINVAGYRGLRVEVPSPRLADEEIDQRIDALRSQHSTLAPAERPAIDDDHVTIDIVGTHDGEEIPGLTSSDYDYRVGSGAVVPEIDENLRGANPGDILQFTAPHPDPDEEGELSFRILVKSVSKPVLPELTDEFVGEATEFATVEELRADTARRIGDMKKHQARQALNDKTAHALAELVDEEIPEALVDNEMESRVRDLALRLRSQGIELGQYLDAVGKDQEEFNAELRVGAVLAVKVDLALRSVADAEGIEADEAQLEEQLAVLASQLGRDVDTLRRQLDEADQLDSMRVDLRKQKAVEWLVEQVEIVDEDGTVLTLADLEVDDDDGDSEESDEAVDAAGTLAGDEVADRDEDDVEADADEPEQEDQP